MNPGIQYIFLIFLKNVSDKLLKMSLLILLKNKGVHFNLSPVRGTRTGAACRGRCPHRPQSTRPCDNLKCILNKGKPQKLKGFNKIKIKKDLFAMNIVLSLKFIKASGLRAFIK